MSNHQQVSSPAAQYIQQKEANRHFDKKLDAQAALTREGFQSLNEQVKVITQQLENEKELNDQTRQQHQRQLEEILSTLRASATFSATAPPQPITDDNGG